MDWFSKYGDKLDFFLLAKSKGVNVTALNEMPELEPDEQFYWAAYSILSDAGYADISKFCEDNLMGAEERQDLITMILGLRAHQRKANANS